MKEEVLVAFQGERGAFSEEAIHALLGAGTATVPCHDFAAVGDAVRSGVAHYGLLPVENSIHGSVTAAYDVLAEGDLFASAQVVLPVRLCLAAPRGGRLEDVRRVVSHPVALAQCQRFLRSLKDVEAVATWDTAGAARDVAAAGDCTVAALASAAAAERFGLDVLRAGVQDRADNQTRFLLVTRAGDEPPRQDAASRLLLLVDLADRPGALVAMLEPFARHEVNLSSIQSRPAGEPWTYRFFIELAAADPAAIQSAIVEVQRRVLRVTTIGCYS